jgi:GDPmannose 4,6-dehydratase
MKSVVFGCSGQDGRLLTQVLSAAGHEVFGVSRYGGQLRGSVADAEFVHRILEAHVPDYIFHLAAISTTRHDALFENHNAISTGTVNVLESARKHCPHARVFLTGSALQFNNSGAPIDEDTPFEAASPYAVARIHSAYMGRYYRAAFGMRVYCGYLFHHDSPMRSEAHINQKIVSAVQRIAGGSTETLLIGDLDVEKEFNYAGDIVDAIWVLVNQDTTFEAVLGCGQTHSIREWIEYCFRSIGRNWKDHVTVERGFQADFARLVSNPARITELGWQPKVSFSALADMMLDAR